MTRHYLAVVRPEPTYRVDHYAVSPLSPWLVGALSFLAGVGFTAVMLLVAGGAL